MYLFKQHFPRDARQASGGNGRGPDFTSVNREQIGRSAFRHLAALVQQHAFVEAPFMRALIKAQIVAPGSDLGMGEFRARETPARLVRQTHAIAPFVVIGCHGDQVARAAGRRAFPRHSAIPENNHSQGRVLRAVGFNQPAQIAVYRVRIGRQRDVHQSGIP